VALWATVVAAAGPIISPIKLAGFAEVFVPEPEYFEIFVVLVRHIMQRGALFGQQGEDALAGAGDDVGGDEFAEAFDV
jgi:hypothetical protein